MINIQIPKGFEPDSFLLMRPHHLSTILRITFLAKDAKLESFTRHILGILEQSRFTFSPLWFFYWKLKPKHRHRPRFLLLEEGDLRQLVASSPLAVPRAPRALTGV